MMIRSGRNVSISSMEVLSLRVDLNIERGVDFPQPLDEVVGKGVVIIENEDHCCVSDERRQIAAMFREPPVVFEIARAHLC